VPRKRGEKHLKPLVYSKDADYKIRHSRNEARVIVL
jgi:hypothetical protein